MGWKKRWKKIRKRFKKVIKRIAKPLAVAVGLGAIVAVASKVQRSITKAKAKRKSIQQVMDLVKVEKTTKVSVIGQEPIADLSTGEIKDQAPIITKRPMKKSLVAVYVVIAAVVIFAIALRAR